MNADAGHRAEHVEPEEKEVTMANQKTQEDFNREAQVPEETPVKTPVESDLSGGEQSNGPARTK